MELGQQYLLSYNYSKQGSLFLDEMVVDVETESAIVFQSTCPAGLNQPEIRSERRGYRSRQLGSVKQFSYIFVKCRASSICYFSDVSMNVELIFESPKTP